MIWSVVSKEEMDGYAIPPVFKYYREVVGKENIKLAVVEESDPLDFVKPDDIVLLRTASPDLISSISRKKVRSTAESIECYKLAGNKSALSSFLKSHGVLVPRVYPYPYSELTESGNYFVKPNFGAESFGITRDNICLGKTAVERQIRVMETTYEFMGPPIVEDFILGLDATVAVYRTSSNELKAHAIGIECNEVCGIQTHAGKFGYDEYCYAITGKWREQLCEISRKVFDILGLKHHARIDFRVTPEGEFYLIDVNLIPGIGPSAHFAKCLLLTENLSYRDAINAIIESAS